MTSETVWNGSHTVRDREASCLRLYYDSTPNKVASKRSEPIPNVLCG
jgi:hypothetical protein